MKNYRLQLNCSSTATQHEIESSFHKLLLENNIMVAEDGDIHLIMVDDITILSCEEDDDENDNNGK